MWYDTFLCLLLFKTAFLSLNFWVVIFQYSREYTVGSKTIFISPYFRCLQCKSLNPNQLLKIPLTIFFNEINLAKRRLMFFPRLSGAKVD